MDTWVTIRVEEELEEEVRTSAHLILQTRTTFCLFAVSVFAASDFIFFRLCCCCLVTVAMETRHTAEGGMGSIGRKLFTAPITWWESCQSELGSGVGCVTAASLFASI